MIKGTSSGLFFISILALTAFISTVLAQSEVDLSISVESTVAVVPVNNNFDTTVTVENLSSEPATFVTITDNLPSGMAFVTSADACVVSASVVNCTIGELPAGELVTVTYTVRANMTGDGIQNNVSVTAAETDPDSSNNVASISIDVVTPEPVDIALSGSVSPAVVDMSDEVTINFLITNADTTPAYLTSIDFVLPAQLEYIASSDCSNTGSVVRCHANIVETGTPQGVVLTVRAVAPGNPVTLEAIVSHADDDPDTANNGASLSFTINEPPADSADLVLSISPSASQFITGESLVMTYVVSNQGPNDASNVSVSHVLPPEMTFISSTDCTFAGNAITCEMGDLGVNELYTVTAMITSNTEMDALSSSISVAGTEVDPNIFNNVQTLVLPSIHSLPATATPMVITATPIMLTSMPLPAVQVVSTQSSVVATPVPAGQGTVPTASDTSNGSNGVANNPLPDGVAPGDIYGWTLYESLDLIQVSGQWYLRTISNASDNGYHESRDAGATLRYPFEGDGFRVGYRSEVNGAAIQIHLDGAFLDIIETNFLTIDADLDPVRQTFVTQAYWVEPGYHVIDFVCMADGGGSEGCNLDYVEIFTGPPIPAQPTQVVVPAGETAVVVDNIELVSAPPTIAPTATTAPASVITVDVIVSVDLNANDQVDANEGIEGITVRAVDVSDNSLLATSVTDSSGFVRVSVSTTNDVILLIPVLGESFYIRNRTPGVQDTWNLLLDPANVPGLIP